MSKTPPNQELDTAPDFGDEPKPQGEVPEDGMREMPTDPPAVAPSIGSEQPAIFAAMGLAGFAKQNPEGGLTGDEDVAWERDLAAANDDGDAEIQGD